MFSYTTDGNEGIHQQKIFSPGKKNVNGTTLQTDIVLGHDTVHHLESITLGTVKCISENIILMYHEILPSNLKQISDILYGELTCRAYLTGVTSE